MTKHEIDKLINRIAEGNTEAAEVLYNELSTPVYFYALHILKDKFAAEDVMQETFIAVLQRSKSYIPNEKPTSWIFTIAKNKAIDYQRKQKDIVSIDADEMTVIANHSEDFGESFFPEMLRCLNEKERDIVVLRVLSGFTLTQIARDLELPKGSVFWTYNNAMKKLRKALKSGGIDNVS